MDDTRASEMRAFLRKMRGRLEPGDAGLPPSTRRRRTSGLRVEEVASLAGVSLTWYAALERGTGIRVSANLLDRVAGALRLNAEEREYLYALARPAPVRAGASAEDPVLRAVVDGFTAGPAFITDRTWQIHTFNELADAVYRFRASPEQNLLARMFLDPYLRELHEQWERIALEMVATVHLAYADASDDPQTLGLVARLSAASPEFAQCWHGFTLRRLGTTATTLNHPGLGRLSLTFARFLAPARREGEGPPVVVMQPAADEETRRRLSVLG